MKTLRNLEVPTGNILTVEGSSGPLELLSLADYGAHVNLNQHKPVVHQALMPLTDKWVVTISTQYGCSMRCKFCDVPKVGPGRNATRTDMVGEVLAGLRLHPEITATQRLNVHFARMGEPSWNPGVLDVARWLYEELNPEYHVHPVVSTMMPRHNQWLSAFLHTWMQIKNELYEGNAGLQLSINSTDEAERAAMFSGNCLTLAEIAEVMEDIYAVGRKITLNFAVAGYTVDPRVLLRHFSPEEYIVKLTPMHKTATALANGIETRGDYTQPEPYLEIEKSLKVAGYDVLVFIASHEEDAGLITCGNAILSGSLPTVPYKEVK